MINHHNTTNESGQLLIDFNMKAQRQEDIILHYTKKGDEIYPSQLRRQLIERSKIPAKTPITSIRRAITNLTKKGFFEKMPCHLKKTGEYGRPETIWVRIF